MEAPSRPVTGDPRPVGLSVAVYRILLAAYPTSFRREYGPHMAQAFRDYALRTHRGEGATGLLSLWAETMLDWFTSVLEEHIQRGIEMTQEKFVRLSGWGMMLGAVVMTVGFLAEPARIRRIYYDLFGGVTQAEFARLRAFSEGAGFMLAALGIVLLVIGVLGLRLRYGQSVGGFGKTALLLSLVGGGVSVMGFVVLAATQADEWWLVMMYGLAAQFGFLALFGLACMRTKPMLRWNASPLMAGVWFPLVVLVTSVYESITGHWLQVSDLFMGAIFFVITASLLLLGHTLQADALPEVELAG